MSRCLLVLALLALCPAARAAAQDEPTEDEPTEDDGVQSFDHDPREFEAQVQLEVGARLAGEGRCEVALGRLERALELADTIDVRFHLGACLHALGRHAEAIAHIERFAAEVDPDADIERASIALRILERARAEVGSLAIVVEPRGALVLVDGRAVIGGGQRVVLLDPGRHVLRAEYVGHETVVRSVEVEPGGRALRLLQLRRVAQAPASIEVEVAPPTARITIDGERFDPRAGVARVVEPGAHRVVLRARGHEPRERSVTVAAGEHLRLDVELPEARDETALIIAGAVALVGAGVLGAVIGFGIASVDTSARAGR